jgi:hypothetical protein
MPYTGLGAYSQNQINPLAFTVNQAALAQINQAAVALYSERRFLLAATSSYAAALALQTKLGHIGIVLNYDGFKNYNENKIGLAYAKSLGTKADVGIQFNYSTNRIPAYGKASAINVEAGAILHISDNLNAGFQMCNPFKTKPGYSGEEKPATALRGGLGYDASANFFISAEIIKEEDKPVNVTAGFQYQFVKQFFVRCGFMSESAAAFAGAGLGFKNLRLDISGSYHPQLGFSPGFLVIVNFGNEK